MGSDRRVQRINELLKRELSQLLLREAYFPDKVFITVTRVEVSPGLNEAKVYISVLPEYSSENILKTLRQRVYDIQKIINKRLRMRPVPKLEFREEKKTKEAGEVEELLEKLKSKKHN